MSKRNHVRDLHRKINREYGKYLRWDRMHGWNIQSEIHWEIMSQWILKMRRMAKWAVN